MFNCASCKTTGDRPVLTVTKTRVVNHRAKRTNRKTRETREVVVGRGSQIVEELPLCEPCSSEVVVFEVSVEPEEQIEVQEIEDETDYTAISSEYED